MFRKQISIWVLFVAFALLQGHNLIPHHHHAADHHAEADHHHHQQDHHHDHDQQENPSESHPEEEHVTLHVFPSYVQAQSGSWVAKISLENKTRFLDIQPLLGHAITSNLLPDEHTFRRRATLHIDLDRPTDACILSTGLRAPPALFS